MLTRSASFLLLLFLVAFVPPASAQDNSVGIYLGTDIGRANQFVGLQGRLGFGTLPLQLAPSFEASFSEGGTRWQLNGDVLYRFGVPEAVFSPSLGAGLGVVQASGSDEVTAGPNLVAGARLVLGPVRPFLQTRLTVAGSATLSFAGGILLRTW